jgi:hypothetical protein
MRPESKLFLTMMTKHLVKQVIIYAENILGIGFVKYISPVRFKKRI